MDGSSNQNARAVAPGRSGWRVRTETAPTKRIRVKDVLDLLAAGVSEKEIIEDYPDLEAEDIKACLQYAAAQADHAVLKVP